VQCEPLWSGNLDGNDVVGAQHGGIDWLLSEKIEVGDGLRMCAELRNRDHAPKLSAGHEEIDDELLRTG
jgi:hypothetical protein